MLNVGHARVRLTPEFEDFYLIGYRDPSRMEPALGVHDDIFANALLLEDEAGERIFIFSADFLEFEEPMAEDVKTLLAAEYGLNRDLVLLCATHDHSSVVGYHRSWYTGKYDQRYYDFLIAQIRAALEGCQATLQPMAATMGSQVVEGWFGNRNHKGVLADNLVTRLEFTPAGPDGQALPGAAPTCGIVSWATHSTVLPGSNRYLTADLAGNVARALEPLLGYEPAMVVGAAGDCSNRCYRQSQDFDELEREVAGLAPAIAGIEAAEPVELGPIRYQTVFHTIHHDMGFVHQDVQAEKDGLLAELAAGCDAARAEHIATRMVDLDRRLAIHEFHLDAKGWVIDLGGLQVLAFPGELGSAFGLQLREAAPKPMILAGYCNGYYEYFLPAAEYGLSFETQGSPIPRGEPEKLIAKFIQVSALLR